MAIALAEADKYDVLERIGNADKSFLCYCREAN